MRILLVRSLALVALLAAMAACSKEHRVACIPFPTAGAVCSFTEPCTQYTDYWMGRCGTETWTCVGGHVVYDDRTFPCARDFGVDAEVDGGEQGMCPQYVPPPATPTACRQASDCVEGACWAPGDTAPFYSGGACPMVCALDTDCADGSVCRTLNGGGCGACVGRCDVLSCALWETCGDDGHCAPAPCATGAYLCPPGAVCGGSGAGVDGHGCARVPCTTDAPCGCGACVEGWCELGPGRCDPLRP